MPETRPEVLRLDFRGQSVRVVGRLRLHERWQWTSGDGSRGESIVEEVRGGPGARENIVK